MHSATVTILRTLRTHWKEAKHPVYRAQERQNVLPGPVSRGEPSRLSRAIFVIAALVAGGLCSAVGFFGLLLLIGSILFLWPILVVVPTSSIIAAERDAQTWDILLTTPFDWQDLLLAKVAARLRDRPPFIFIFLWILGNVCLIALNTPPVAVQPARSVIQQQIGLGETFTCLMLPFLIGYLILTGMQEYIMAGLIGLLISLFSATQQTARATAVLVAAAMAVVNALLVTLLVQGADNIVSLLPIISRWLVAGLVLGLILLIREFAIRWLFAFLVRHVGDATSPILPRLRGTNMGA